MKRLATAILLTSVIGCGDASTTVWKGEQTTSCRVQQRWTSTLAVDPLMYNYHTLLACQNEVAFMSDEKDIYDAVKEGQRVNVIYRIGEKTPISNAVKTSYLVYELISISMP